ncbi:hypothetical protein EVAR_32590_1 [Eumeta japonica]|uniref:Reverse transcriptase domain-containing protein n=1 Tax=Eumeta variegata TaxID=151549 RepID=A0A4C1VRY7_EUMVA|nr:hypothetical protein EVAR_32590_1 [Eumeta japonica]
MDKLSVKYLLYAADQVILAASAYELQEMVPKINDSVKKRGKKVIVCKTKVMVFERSEGTTDWDIYSGTLQKAPAEAAAASRIINFNSCLGTTVALMNYWEIGKSRGEPAARPAPRARVATHFGDRA